ncbi:MAG: APC family permease [Patescibacteria group bacterium]
MSSAKTHIHKLNQFYATAIAGNDILSSALYVSGIAAIFAGIYAPLVLLCVALVLFFYKSVYREVVGALPVNGGAYNALLNGTGKTFAAVAGVMTVLSYVATGVISGKTAVEYLFQFLGRIVPTVMVLGHSFALASLVLPAVILVLFAFAVLVIVGVKDSAGVAAAIFVFHIITLVSFIAFGIWFVALHGTGIWTANIAATAAIITRQGGFLKTIFLAFSASLLGVSGFESSANFVEEQGHGVFPKTLRNMAIGVLIFNPLIAAVVLNLLTLPQIVSGKDFVLANAALGIGGMFFLGWIAIDAFLVLCGAVLTSYVGVTGLINRMALDGCLPTALSKKNSRGSYTRIVLAFFLLCVSILLVTKGELLSLAGVYTISFLSVMTFFAASNLILRINRPDLKRPYKAPIILVLVALLSTFIGVMGNIAIDPRNTGFFLTYFIPAILFVFCVMYRKRFYAGMKRLTISWPKLHRFFDQRYDAAADDRIVAFVHHVDRLFPILDYIHKNESGQNVTLVHCRHGHKIRAHQLEHLVKDIKLAGFYPTFNINVDYEDQPFGAKAVKDYARRHRIPANKIFIGSIHHYHEFNYEDLGGVRVIL